MYTTKIKYTDYNDQEKETILRFHLNKQEVLDWAMQDGNASFDQVIIRIMEKQNTKDMMDAFTDLIARSYGEKTEDGRFEKDDEIYKRFKSSAAYPEFYMMIATDESKALEFLKGIMPKDISDELDSTMKSGGAALPENIRSMLPKA